MKLATLSLALVVAASGTIGFAQSSRSISIIPRPAFPNGSNASRAPFPGQRVFDDVHGPDGQAIDPDLPPNTPATRPPLLQTRVAVLQPGAKGVERLAPVGLPSTGLRATLDANRVSASIRAGSVESRRDLLAQLDAKLSAADQAIDQFDKDENRVNRADRTQFTAAENTMREREAALFKSMRAAQDATPDRWEAVREELAANYDAYASAAAQVDAVMGLRR
jgi:hypothetical protein